MKTVMTKKFIPLIIIAILLPAVLASCEGIGDGALIGDITGADGSSFTAIIKSFDASANEYAESYITDEEAKELYNAFDSGEYVEGLERNAIEMPFLELTFGLYKLTNRPQGSSFDGTYRIYIDDFVIWKTSDGIVPKGHLDGMYEKLMTKYPILSKSKHNKSAEAEAGFSFSSLMVATEPGKNYTASDFSEIGCIFVKPLTSTEDASWWVLKLDSDKKEEILDSLEKLKARDDILGADLDYIVTLD